MDAALEPAPTLDALLRRARERGRAGLIPVDGRGRPGERRAWSAVLAGAERAAASLAALGVGPREPLLVLLPPGEAFLSLWLGAVLRGAWPVAAAPPVGLGSSEHALRRVAAVHQRLGGTRVIAPDSVAAEARALGLDAFAAAVIAPEAALATDGARFDAPEPEPDDVAFLQLTSGSTGTPRAVRIAHRGAAHNPRAMVAAVAACDPELERAVRRGALACVSWLPLHHDMGLVGCLLTSLAADLDLWLSAPRTFLGRPDTWLHNLAAAGLAASPAPNFAYQTCAERDLGLGAIDLSGWRAALCGAEMIRPETVAAFVERHAPLGFRADAFRACYGLAEATLAVTLDRAGRGLRTHAAPDGRAVACLGKPVEDTAVAVVGPDGRALKDGEVGDVRVQGPGVFQGYHQDPEATAAALRDGWLATGDRGFLRHGELYLTGRTKEILILHGQNLMPHELEWIAESAAGGGARAAAFSIDAADGERAVLVVETAPAEPEALGALAREIRARIGRALGLVLADCAFVRRGRLPKTTSGKVQRLEVRRRYLAQELEREDAREAR